MATLASLLVPGVSIPQHDFSVLGNIAESLGGAVDEFGQRRSYGKLADMIGTPQATAQQPAGGFLSSLAPQPAQTPQTAAAPVMPVQRGPIPDTYYASIRSAESGGNDAAKNPRSSATGRYQFTEGTWNGLMQQHPELALTADGRLDPNQQERAIRAFTQNNAQTLSRAGIPVNPGNLYAAHFLGSGGATSVLSQDDNAPISNFVGADVIQANPFLNGMTVGQFKQWSAEKGGRAGGGYNAPSAMDAVNELASGGGAPLSDQAFDDRFGPSVAPVVGAEALSAALSGGEDAATEQPAAYAPNQVADASGSFAGVPGVQPIPRGGVNPEIIQFMLRDPNLREAGLKLWAQNATGSTGEEWQFVNGADGTLLRANQRTGAVEPIGNFGRNQQQFRVLTPEERTQYGIGPEDRRVYQIGPNGQISAVGGAGQTINVGNEVEARRAAAAQAGLSEDDPRYQGFILTGKIGKESEQDLTATDKKAILEADEAVMNAEGVLPLLGRALELNDQAYSGPFAGTRGMITGTLGSDAGEATLELDNVVTGQALGQLKAIFGGAPTEGERKILLDMSGSSSLPPAVRKGIYQRAMQAVERRLQTYRDRANELRGGTFYKPGSRSNKGNRTSSGVTWEIVE